jgi:cyanate permease
MATILLIIIYAVFIGLGLPDSVLGTAWPAIYVDLNLPVGNASVLTMLMSVCTAVASFFSARIINKFGI